MNLHKLAAIGATAASGAAIWAASAPADSTHSAAVKKITPAGVGAVKLGATYKSLHHKGLIGKIKHGCELGGPNTRSADLKPPLAGSVNFTLKSPRKVTDIQSTGGAKARGVGIGATIADIKKAFPKAKADHSTDHTFGFTLVRVPKSGGGKLGFAVTTGSKEVIVIGVPQVAVCE
jgi:hypothetical protein